MPRGFGMCNGPCGNHVIHRRANVGLVPDRSRYAEAALLTVLSSAINLMFRQFDCRRSTYRRYTGFVLAFAKSDFPSPTTATNQLNDGVFYSFVLHEIPPQKQRLRRTLDPAFRIAADFKLGRDKITFFRTPVVPAFYKKVALPRTANVIHRVVIAHRARGLLPGPGIHNLWIVYTAWSLRLAAARTRGGAAVRKASIASVSRCPRRVCSSLNNRHLPNELAWQFGAGGGTRTHTTLPSRDFKSLASTSSATSALVTRSET